MPREHPAARKVIMDERAYHQPIDSGAYGPPTEGRREGAQLVKLVAASVLCRSGEPYFDSLLRLLSAQFDVSLALVGLIDGDGVETIVLFEGGQRGANIRYALKGTPCETIFSPQQICVYTEDVAELFPADEVLDQIGAVGYAGMPLFDRDGTPIGIMALCSSSPLDAPEELAEMLKVFGKRSSLELEHLIALRSAAEKAARIEDEAFGEESSLAEYVRRLAFGV